MQRSAAPQDHEPVEAAPLLLVIGASGGIGNASVVVAQSDGVNVLGVDRVSKPHGKNPPRRSIQADLATDQGRAVVMRALPRVPRMVIYAAGSPAEFGAKVCIQDNFVAPALFLGGLIPMMGRDSSVTVVGSLTKKVPRVADSELQSLLHEPDLGKVLAFVERDSLSDRGTYALSKFLITSWALRASSRHMKDGVRVNVVSPAVTRSPAVSAYERSVSAAAVQKGRKILGKDLDPIDVAEAIAFLSYGRGSSWINGMDLTLDGGLLNYLRCQGRKSDEVHR